jgi:hypothetical protein
MTSADLVYGERRFGQTYAIRVLWALLMLGPLLLAWSVVGKPNPLAQPVLAIRRKAETLALFLAQSCQRSH